MERPCDTAELWEWQMKLPVISNSYNEIHLNNKDIKMTWRKAFGIAVNECLWAEPQWSALEKGNEMLDIPKKKKILKYIKPSLLHWITA